MSLIAGRRDYISRRGEQRLCPRYLCSPRGVVHVPVYPPPASAWTKPSRPIGSLFHDHPLKLSEKGVDVHGAPFPQAAIYFSRQSQPTSLAMSSVKNYVDVGVAGKTLLHRCVRQRSTTRNDK